MGQGFAIDHVTPAGRLVTVFSAPDYPQFQARRGVPCSSYEDGPSPQDAKPPRRTKILLQSLQKRYQFLYDQQPCGCQGRHAL